LAAVEFAIVGMILMIILFAIIEFGRVLHAFNVLEEAARRGARVAAICPVNDPNIMRVALWVPLSDFSAANVDVAYLDATLKPTTVYTAINFVRVTTHDYSITLRIPVIEPTIKAPSFSSTLTRESLGVPHAGGTVGCYPAK
jgi:Flp pilus assembly protein TadG